MAGIDFRSLFTTEPQRQLVSGLGATSEWRIKPTTFSEDDHDSRFPAFQKAWKQGAGLTDLFGPNPFELHGTVAPSGGDNHRPDVTKVQTLLGNAGYVGIRDGGPNGYPSEMLDSAIRQFQQDKGLKVDGVLKPGGPTITALGGLLGGSAQTLAKPTAQKGLFGEFNGTSDSITEGEWDWMDKGKRAPDWRTKPEALVPPAGRPRHSRRPAGHPHGREAVPDQLAAADRHAHEQAPRPATAARAAEAGQGQAHRLWRDPQRPE